MSSHSPEQLAREGAALAGRGEALRTAAERLLVEAMQAVRADPALWATLGPESRRDVETFLRRTAAQNASTRPNGSQIAPPDR